MADIIVNIPDEFIPRLQEAIVSIWPQTQDMQPSDACAVGATEILKQAVMSIERRAIEDRYIELQAQETERLELEKQSAIEKSAQEIDEFRGITNQN